MIRIRFAAVALALATIPMTVEAQDRWQSQVRNQMSRVVARVESNGFSLTPQYYHGRLDAGRTDVVNLNLVGSREYFIVAACDVDCSDLDLSLLESDGRELAADRRPDSLPIIQVPEGHGGTHPIRISMETCSVNPCRYEIAVFSR